MFVNDKYPPDWELLDELYSPEPDDVFHAMSTEEQQELVAGSFVDFAYRVLLIHGKATGGPTPFLLNKEQRYLLFIMDKMMAEKGHLRLAICKGRQVGTSTLIGAYLYWLTISTKGFRTFILSHEKVSTQHLFDMVSLYHDSAVEFGFNIPVDRSNTRELRFYKDHSGYRVGSAGSQDIGRSMTISAVHWSEVAASGAQSDSHLTGLLQSVPSGKDIGGTIIILESTAKGIGNTYHRSWVDAVEGTSGFWAVFVAWYWHERYRDPATRTMEELDETERMLVHRYGLDLEQIAFRYNKINSGRPPEGVSRTNYFKEQYPSFWTEAFLYSGENYFEADDIVFAEKRAVHDAPRYEIVNGKLKPSEVGRFIMYEMPKSGSKYVVGADPAGGVPGGNNSAVCVKDCNDGRTVATFAGIIRPGPFGEVLEKIARVYNDAYLCPEANNHGGTVLERLYQLRYPHIHFRTKLHSDGRTTREQGWGTTQPSRHKIIEALEEDLHNGVWVRDPETCKEMHTFIINDNGKPEAAGGYLDDRLFAAGIASQMWRHKMGKRWVDRTHTEQAREKKAKRAIEAAQVKARQERGATVAKVFGVQRASGPVKSASSRELQIEERRAHRPSPAHFWSDVTQNWHLDPSKSRVVMPSTHKPRGFGM